MLLYPHVVSGIFLSRPNRFIANVDIGGRLERCHVKNTGRCKELLIPGAAVYLEESDKPGRSTKFDLTAVWKGARLINMDSQAPNRVFLEHLRSGEYLEGLTLIRPETARGDSRFDFYVEAGERKIFIEVKGVTLEKDGAALFPDAPTARGLKHLKALVSCIGDGFEAHVVFIIQMKDIACFRPNMDTHPAFGAALAAAKAAGVRLLALECATSPDSMSIGPAVPVILPSPSGSPPFTAV